MDWQQLAVFAIAAGAAAYLVLRNRVQRSKPGCGGCGTCPPAPSPDVPARPELVQIGGVAPAGRPQPEAAAYGRERTATPNGCEAPPPS